MTPSQYSRKVRLANWINDKGDGPFSSLNYLCKWMSNDDNFKAFHGHCHLKKQKAAQQCADWMKAQNCPNERDTDSIIKKASSLHLYQSKSPTDARPLFLTGALLVTGGPRLVLEMMASLPEAK